MQTKIATVDKRIELLLPNVVDGNEADQVIPEILKTLKDIVLADICVDFGYSCRFSQDATSKIETFFRDNHEKFHKIVFVIRDETFAKLTEIVLGHSGLDFVKIFGNKDDAIKYLG